MIQAHINILCRTIALTCLPGLPVKTADNALQDATAPDTLNVDHQLEHFNIALNRKVLCKGTKEYC